MPVFDHGFKMVAQQAGRDMARMAGVPVQSWTPLTGDVQTVERLADRAFHARQGRERFVVYFEAYTVWNDDARWSVLAKSGLLAERERLPVVSIVFVLLPRGYHPQQGTFRQEALGGPTQQVWFREVCLWDETPEAWWEEAPALMTLYPLCRHQQPPEEAIRHAAAVIKRREHRILQRADDLAILTFFGGLAYPRLRVIDIIGRERMKESSFYREVSQEGRVEMAREDILHVLGVRIGEAASAEFAPTINSLSDLPLRREGLGLAARSNTAEEFRTGLATLQQQMGGRRPRRSRRGSSRSS